MTARTQPSTTTVLRAWSGGSTEDRDRALVRLYDELRRLAASFLARERVDHTLQPTALVHELYLRLDRQRPRAWANKAQFMALAGKVMRRLLVDHARRRLRLKRGGERIRVPLASLQTAFGGPPEAILAVHDSLAALGTLDPRKASVVELHFFAGLSVAETAAALECSPATITRDWRLAKAWLARDLASPAA